MLSADVVATASTVIVVLVLLWAGMTYNRLVRQRNICNRFHGPGWALAGDAAAFVDPLFSTGVTLAMRSASQVAKAVGESLRDPAAEETAIAAYDDSHRAFFEQVLQFVRFFYNRAYSKEQYWAIAQSIIDPDMVNSPKIDFATFLSGLFGAEPNPEAMQEVMSLLK